MMPQSLEEQIMAMLNSSSFNDTNFYENLTQPDNNDYDTKLYQDLARFQYYAWGITGNIIAVLGLIGNVFSIIVLGNRRMMSSTSCYLIALGVFDSVVLISLVLFFSLPTFYIATGKLESYYRAYPYMHPYAYPTALIAQTCSIYTTVAFTVERWIAVCRPLRAAKMCTISRARKSILIIMFCSIVYNIPRMLEYRTTHEFDPNTNTTRVTNTKTALGADPTFQHIYFIYMHIFVMLLIPFTTLAVLNILLIRAVKQSEHATGKVSNKTKRENSLTVMLISVVVVFLICQVPSIVDNIFTATLNDNILYQPPFVKLTTISGLMVIANSATNFYLYCVFGRKFRRVFCRIFCTCYLRATRSLLLNDNSSMVHHPPTNRSTTTRLNTTTTTTRSPTTYCEGTLGTVKSALRSQRNKFQMSIYENGKTRTYCTSSLTNMSNGKYVMVNDQDENDAHDQTHL
uniref:Orphan G-protein coupled receptor 28 n=1 Tax=Platynereis dumerilii TaxID=6359 RepID=A0A0K0PUU4_PLADU|nr:orphan G-protein coupled receptor 28 [Platynereis dumerilii]